MRCCIACSTTSRLKDNHNQTFVGTTSKHVRRPFRLALRKLPPEVD